MLLLSSTWACTFQPKGGEHVPHPISSALSKNPRFDRRDPCFLRRRAPSYTETREGASGAPYRGLFERSQYVTRDPVLLAHCSTLTTEELPISCTRAHGADLGNGGRYARLDSRQALRLASCRLAPRGSRG
jgi:hypothetical protein